MMSVIGVIALVGIVIGIVLLVKGKDSKKESNETVLVETLEKMGATFYKDFYYLRRDTDKERVEQAKLLADTGVGMTLENLKISQLSYIQEHKDDFVNALTGEACDAKKSRVQIYPKSPYGAEDFEVKVTLVCGFDEE